RSASASRRHMVSDVPPGGKPVTMVSDSSRASCALAQEGKPAQVAAAAVVPRKWRREKGAITVSVYYLRIELRRARPVIARRTRRSCKPEVGGARCIAKRLSGSWRLQSLANAQGYVQRCMGTSLLQGWPTR